MDLWTDLWESRIDRLDAISEKFLILKTRSSEISRVGSALVDRTDLTFTDVLQHSKVSTSPFQKTFPFCKLFQNIFPKEKNSSFLQPKNINSQIFDVCCVFFLLVLYVSSLFYNGHLSKFYLS